MQRLFVVLAALLVAARPLSSQSPRATPTNHWTADLVHSTVAFRVRHLGITWVNGGFGKWTADLTYDPANPSSASVTAKIQAASISTGNPKRDNDVRRDHLMSDSFPEITFTSTRVERVGPEKLRISGNLTMRGITHPVVLDTEVSDVLATSHGRRTAFSATTTIRRQDYGIVLNNFMEGAQVVGDDVRVTLDIEAVEDATTP